MLLTNLADRNRWSSAFYRFTPVGSPSRWHRIEIKIPSSIPANIRIGQISLSKRHDYTIRTIAGHEKKEK
jgi:hypothetical protein